MGVYGNKYVLKWSWLCVKTSKRLIFLFSWPSSFWLESLVDEKKTKRSTSGEKKNVFAYLI